MKLFVFALCVSVALSASLAAAANTKPAGEAPRQKKGPPAEPKPPSPKAAADSPGLKKVAGAAAANAAAKKAAAKKAAGDFWAAIDQIHRRLGKRVPAKKSLQGQTTAGDQAKGDETLAVTGAAASATVGPKPGGKGGKGGKAGKATRKECLEPWQRFGSRKNSLQFIQEKKAMDPKDVSYDGPHDGAIQCGMTKSGKPPVWATWKRKRLQDLGLTRDKQNDLIKGYQSDPKDGTRCEVMVMPIGPATAFVHGCQYSKIEDDQNNRRGEFRTEAVCGIDNSMKEKPNNEFPTWKGFLYTSLFFWQSPSPPLHHYASGREKASILYTIPADSPYSYTVQGPKGPEKVMDVLLCNKNLPKTNTATITARRPNEAGQPFKLEGYVPFPVVAFCGEAEGRNGGLDAVILPDKDNTGAGLSFVGQLVNKDFGAEVNGDDEARKDAIRAKYREMMRRLLQEDLMKPVKRKDAIRAKYRKMMEAQQEGGQGAAGGGEGGGGEGK